MRIVMIGQKGFDVGEFGGGIEQHVTQLSRRLAREGHAVTVYARSKQVHIEDAEVCVKYLPTIYRKHLEAIVHTLLASLDTLFHPYDIIHYHGVGPALLCWIPRLFKPRSSVIVTFHSQDRFHQKWGSVARFFLFLGEWAACWLPHATIAVSHAIQVYARKTLHRQIIFIPNGAEPEGHVGTSELTMLGLRPHQYLLSVSRLEPHKGQWYLIEAFRRLEQDRPDLVSSLKLVLVGASAYSDDYEQSLRRMARGSQNIVFLGFQTGETLKQLFAHARLFVHPSEAEGLPVVVLEAMGCATPVLVSNIPENVEAIHQAGFTFYNKDVNDLVVQFERVLADKALLQEMGKRGQSVVQTYFSWEVVTQKTEAVYRSMRH